MATASESIRVLYVDDEPGFADTAASFLEREDDRLRVRTATDPEEGLAALAERAVDCVVSDYDMPDTNGIELLELVREEYPDLPYILYTGKGSEKVASDAISAGVTDYLQKEVGTSQYTLLANRISNAVEAERSSREASRRRHRLEQILKTVPGCVVQLDTQGRFVFANTRAEDVLGLARDDVTDRAYNDPEWEIRDLDGDPIPDEDLPFRQVRDTGTPLYGFKHAIRWPDGSRKALLINGAPLFDADGTVDSVVFSLTDITDQRIQERELAEMRRRLELALEGTDTGVWEWDLQTDEVRWNATLERTMGFDPGEFGGTLEAFVGRVHPDDISDVRQEIDRAIETDTLYQAEFRMREKGGEYQWANVRGRIIHDDAGDRMVGTHQNITARKERERQLTAVKNQYQTLVDNFPNGGVFLFDHECRYVRVGGEEVEATGLSEEELVGSTPHDFFPEAIATELVEHYQDTLDGQSHTFEQELAGSRYRIQTAPVRADDGDIVYGMAVSKNVTEAVERRKQLERQNDRLDRFASVVSHDLRNPLNVAQGHLELAREDDDNEHLTTVATALDRSFTLIDDLLTLAREGEAVTALEPTDLESVCRSCWRNVETADATLRVQTDRTVQADLARLKQLLENIFRNSVEHSSTGPRSQAHGDSVEHSSTSNRAEPDDNAEHASTDSQTSSDDAVEHTDSSPTIVVGTLDEEPGFYVEDDGPGIPPEKREQVFEVGYSTVDDGTGFGLSIVAEIADAHDWDIRATEGRDGGARFEITGVAFDGT